MSNNSQLNPISSRNSFKDITKKRNQYLFVSSTCDDISRLYGVDFSISEKKANDLKENSQESKTKCAVKKSSILLMEDASTEDSDDVISFFSSAIPRLFSSHDYALDDSFGISREIANTDFPIDDIFLQSFSSPHFAHQAPYYSSNTNYFLAHSLRFSPEALIENTSLVILNPLEKQLMDYFVKSIGPYCVCYPKIMENLCLNNTMPDLNPYLYLLVPLALKSPLVLKALVASSAKQLVLLGKNEYQGTARKYTFEVLKELPQMINQKQLTNEDNWDDVLATMIMLCFTEISVSCNKSWLVHLNGAKQFLKESCIRNNLSAVGRFFVRYFISHEVMAETAWICDTYQQSLQTISDDPCIENLKNDVDVKIDLVLGCSPYLISLIHKISVLGKCFEDLEVESAEGRASLEKEILYQAEILKISLTNLKQQLPSKFTDDVESLSHVERIAEIKRLAALIYLFARIQLEYHAYHEPNNPSIFAKSKEYIRQIMRLHGHLPGCYVSLLWPIFIVGIISTDEEERWFVLNSMTQMEKHRELRSVKTAKDVVVSIWKEKDLGAVSIRWKDTIKGKANTISLA